MDAEHLFTSGEQLWANWAKEEDHGLMVYAFCAGRYAWQEPHKKENNYPTVSEQYYLGGAGVRGDSPIFCGECAADLAAYLMLEVSSDNNYTAEEDPESVYLHRLKLTTEEKEEVRFCPCGNTMFDFYTTKAVIEAHLSGELSLASVADLMYIQGTIDQRLYAGQDTWCDPIWQQVEEN